VSERRQQILEIARAMFAEQGVKATTVRQIGNRAGILSGSLYHHFGSKQDLVDGVLLEFCEDIIGRYREIAASDDDAVTKVRDLIAHAFTMIVDHRAAVLIVQTESAYLRTFDRFGYLDDTAREIQRIWETTIADGIAQGVLRPSVVPHLFYRVLYDAVAGAVHWYDPDGPMPISELAERVSDLVLVGSLTDRDG
jgi:AcrR family transcriptional regulator